MFRVVAVFFALVPLAAHALLPSECPPRPCLDAVTCTEKSDWIVEGRVVENMNTTWLEEARLLRGSYPVYSETTYLADTSQCWKALAERRRMFVNGSIHGKRVRAYGTKPSRPVGNGLVFVEILP